MVAEKVTLYTKSYMPEAKGYIWTSDGIGSYSIEEAEDIKRGTKIVLSLKSDAHEFGKEATVNRIIKQYSSFVTYPIKVNGETINTVEPLWTKNKNEISENEYTEFYKFIANAYDEPTYKLHFSFDAPLAINSLLFVPGENYEKFGFSKVERGINLFCKKVMIEEKSEAIAPEWMRFVRGVIDSEELPLNISREALQDSALIAKVNKVVTSRFIKYLDEQAKNDPEKYKEFWGKFSGFLKEGAASDFVHKNEIIKLLRFESNKGKDGEIVSLSEYVDRMKEDQKAIYYINGSNREIIESGPYLEMFKNKDLEVLYTYEAIDDYRFNNLNEFEGKKIVAAEQDSDELPLEEKNDENDSESSDIPKDELTDLTGWLKETLGEKVAEVRESRRLVDSPAVVLSSTGTHSMQRVMQAMNKDFGGIVPGILEINCKHSVIKGINELRKKNDDFAKVAAEQILENAQIAAGLITDPRGMVNRLYSILERAVEK